MRQIFIILILCLLSCIGTSRNEIVFNDSIDLVKKILIETDIICRKINSDSEAFAFTKDSIYIDDKLIDLKRDEQGYPFNQLSKQEYKKLIYNLKVLHANKIASIRGPFRTGFICFGYNASPDDDWGDRLYLTIAYKGFILPREYRKIDEVSSIIIFSNK